MDKNNESFSFPVVGVGASLGGLEAFSRFLSALPQDTGMAFVLIQHLHRHRDTLLSKLLAPKTKMPVEEITEGLRIAPNHIYTIPARYYVSLGDHTFSLTDRDEAKKVNFAINFFFKSLAEVCGDKAIGIVLTGLDADGAQGLEVIKKRGGITFAQNEETAREPSMPKNAIKTNCVDHILSPEEIALELGVISSAKVMDS
jgi:two-component system, chemotaxis family, CheB/CheR fusion protein